MRAKKKEVETAIGEMIDTIERFYNVAPFRFIWGEDDEVGCNSFHRYKTPFHMFDSWFERWLLFIEPHANETQLKLKAAQGTIDEVLPDDDKIQEARRIIADGIGELAFSAERVGFYLGVLVGCKAMGASREQLMEKSQGLVIPLIGKEKNHE